MTVELPRCDKFIVMGIQTRGKHALTNGSLIIYLFTYGIKHLKNGGSRTRIEAQFAS
jgi:hypothetical protein